MTLEELRGAIDGIDDRVLDLLRERAELVEKVGQVKDKSGDPYYAPEREEALLRPRTCGCHQWATPI
jgi:chorismate mutase-like protein